MSTHISADVQRITLNASCMTISGGRTKQLCIFRRVTGFTSDFLSFIVVEHIRFFHGAIQFSVESLQKLKSSLFSSLNNSKYDYGRRSDSFRDRWRSKIRGVRSNEID